MTRSELIEKLTAKLSHFSERDVELAVKRILEAMNQSLSQGDRIEIRGFGSFTLHKRSPFQGRNPRTGKSVAVSAKYRPHFKPGKSLQEQVNQGFQRGVTIKTRSRTHTA